MRTMLKVSIPVEGGNKSIQSGNMPKVIEKLTGMLHPEATYFSLDNGERTAFVFFDMKESHQLPQIGELLFQELGAKIHVTPAMNVEDLKKGLAGAMNHAASR